MKQLTCEMCGSTDLIKESGVFVCQSCGCKYSVEEAKKMMVEGTVEVKGSVHVQNAAQLESILKLAHSSFESKNYAQAEAFCNQVIVMDDKNYEAWKLKGESINFQISSNNQRILEVYNCIMTSYRVLDEEQKKEKKHEILNYLINCFEGEVAFWLQQIEVNRPSETTVEKAKSAYIDAYNKMSEIFDELELNESKQTYLTNLSNLFITKANSICVSAWESTVGYNYYRDDIDNLGSNWGTGSTWSNLVTSDTDSYRPTKQIIVTFIEESLKLIELLQYAEEQFNGKTSNQTKKEVYYNIIDFYEKLLKAGYYKIGIEGISIGWQYEGGLSDEAKGLYQEMIDLTKRKIQDIEDAEANKKIEKTREEYKDAPIEDILSVAHEKLSRREYIEAGVCFDIIMEKRPTYPVGYIGKALSTADDNEIKALEYVRKAAQYMPGDDKVKDELKRIINCGYGVTNITLLMVAAANYDFESVKYLIEYGANINAKTEGNVTALWFVCHKAIGYDKLETARKIARILLDHGAQVDVTSSSGVALLNKDTDIGMVRMIFEKFPNITLPIRGKETAKSSNSGSGGCYVATAVYGSYDCPQVWTLRRFRDNTLAETWYGRAFIHTYYAISPALVKWFGHTEWFKTMWRGVLDTMVENLNANGVEDTPYNDKQW